MLALIWERQQRVLSSDNGAQGAPYKNVRNLAFHYLTIFSPLRQATTYSTTAVNMTPLKPISMASNTASMALSTEAQPLIPQAQGISCGAVFCTLIKPSGKGMPMANASGAANTNAARIRAVSDNDIMSGLINGNINI